MKKLIILAAIFSLSWLQPLHAQAPSEQEYQDIIHKIVNGICALKEKYPELAQIEDIEKFPDGGATLDFQKDGISFRLMFYRGQYEGAAMFIPIQFGDLNLWFDWKNSNNSSIIGDISLVIKQVKDDFDKRYPGLSLKHDVQKVHSFAQELCGMEKCTMLSIYDYLSPKGHEEAVKILKTFLLEDRHGHKMTQEVTQLFFNAISAIGYFANEDDEAFNFIKSYLHPARWKEKLTWTSEMKDYLYEYLTHASIQAIGLSGRPEGKSILEELKQKDAGYIHRFAGDITQAAFYYAFYDEGGREVLEKFLSTEDDTMQVFHNWIETPSGKTWYDWGNQVMSGPQPELKD